MAHYKLYCIGASGNAYKVALYLNCAGLDWEPMGVDFAGGQMRDEAWRASTNAMGEVPGVGVCALGGRQGAARRVRARGVRLVSVDPRLLDPMLVWSRLRAAAV